MGFVRASWASVPSLHGIGADIWFAILRYAATDGNKTNDSPQDLEAICLFAAARVIETISFRTRSYCAILFLDTAVRCQLHAVSQALAYALLKS
jgi:hypothetical protein